MSAPGRGLVLAAAVAWVSAPAWAEGGVFEAEAGERLAGGPAPSLRATRVDFGRLAEARDSVLRGGGARLRLNLFADAELTAVLERAASTPRGYALSGRVEGEAESSVTLVANGDVALGTVWTPRASYQLRTVGAGQVVERAAPPGPPGVQGAAGRGGEFCLGAVDGAPAERAAEGGDDGSVIDVLVLYTPDARRESGGHRATLAKIDHNVAWTNNAYALSDVALRIRLVAAVEATGYREAGLYADIRRLRDPEDGHLDEAHKLADAYAADYVLMQVSNDWGLAGTVATAGLGGRSLARTGRVFAHELGHLMGLNHEREDSLANRPFPYSHGYTGYAGRNRFGTIMARPGLLPRFSNPNHFHEGRRLGVFGDEPSVSVDGPADAARHLNELRRELAGVRESAGACRYRLSPADAEVAAGGGTYALEVQAPAGCAWRARAADGFIEVTAGGSGAGDGRVEYRVSANAGWGREAALAVAGEMHVAWQPGGRAIKPVCERTATVRDAIAAAAGKECGEVTAEDLAAVARLLIGALPPPAEPGLWECDPPRWRQQGVESNTCWEIGPLPAPGDFDGLSGLGRLEAAVEDGELAAGTFDGLGSLVELQFHRGLLAAGPGAFDGLDNLLALWARFSELRPGAFQGLSRVDSLRLYGGRLSALEPGVFDGVNSAMSELYLDSNNLRSVPVGAFRGLSGLEILSLDGNGLSELRPGVFDDVPNLLHLGLGDNDLSLLEPGVFRGLSGLYTLSVGQNALATLEPGVFDGLDSLYWLWLGNYRLGPEYPRPRSETENDFGALRPGAFDGVKARTLVGLRRAGLDTLRPGVFNGLEARALDLRDNGLAEVGPDAFDGLAVNRIDLSDNRLESLDAHAFRGIRGLTLVELSNIHRLGVVDLSNNRLETLPAGLFADLPKTGVLDLSNNRLEHLPEGAVPWCVRDLRLEGNRLAALPKGIFVGGQRNNWNANPLLFGLCGANVHYDHIKRVFVTLHDNPGAPFAAVARPVRVGSNAGVRFDDGAPFDMRMTLSVGGVAHSGWIYQGQRLSRLVPLQPSADEPLVVGVSGLPEVPAPGECHTADLWQWTVNQPRNVRSTPLCYTGLRLAAGAPLVLNAIPDRSLAACDFPQRIGLADVFLEFAGEEPAYAARSSDPATVDAYVGGGTLAVRALKAGAATVTVTATAADGRTAARTFAVDAEGACAVKPVCERSAAARDAIAAAAGRECGEVTAEDLAALAALEVGAPPSPGDFDGLSGLRRLEATVADGGLAADTFHGLGGLAELRLRSGRVAAGPGAFDGLRSLRLLRARFSELRPGAFRDLAQVAEMELGGGGLGALEPGVFDDVPNLVGLGLSGNGLSRLEPGVFRGLSRLVRLSLGRNALAALEPGAFGGLDSLRHLDLSRNRLSALPPNLLRALPGLRTLELAHNRLGALPERFFAGAGVGRLSLHGNPGAPFVLRAGPRRAPGSDQGRGFASRVAVHVPQGAPVALDFRLSASGGRLDGSRSRADAPVASGGTRSRAWDVAPDGAGPVAVAAELFADLAPEGCGEDTRLPAFEDDCLTGLHVEVDGPLVLNGVPDGRLSTDDRWRVALENVFLEFPMAGTSYAASSSDPAVAGAAVEGGALVVTPRREGEAAVTITATAADGRTATRTFAAAVHAADGRPFLRGWRLSLLAEDGP